jgi:hypothetical protein
MPAEIRVQNLRIEGVVDEADDPYGGHGFSGAYAYTGATDASLLSRLQKAADDKASITLKCSRLEVDGTVVRLMRKAGATAGQLEISDVRFVLPPPKRGMRLN